MPWCDVAARRHRRRRQFAVDDRSGDHVLRIQRREPAREVFQFAHIAGPAMLLHAFQRQRIELLRRQSVLFGQREEMPDQIGQILDPLAQRRKPQRHDVEAEEQVLAEQALLNQDPQILVARRDDAHVGLDRRAAADGGVFALLQHPQQPGLRLHRHVADFVEKQRSAFGLLEPAGGAGIGAGEGAAFMAEQFGFDQIARDGRHVDGNERPVAPLAVVVQRARHQLLAGAGLAGNHHGEIGLHQPRQHPVDFLHRRRAADQRYRVEFGFVGMVGDPLLRLGQRPPDDRDQFLQVERLRQIFIRAALGGADRRHEGVLRAHHDDGKIRPHLLDPRQQIERVLVGHHHVGDDQIALALADPAPQRRRVSRQPHLVSGARKRLIENRADGSVVVGDKYTTCGHRYSSSCVL